MAINPAQHAEIFGAVRCEDAPHLPATPGEQEAESLAGLPYTLPLLPATPLLVPATVRFSSIRVCPFSVLCQGRIRSQTSIPVSPGGCLCLAKVVCLHGGGVAYSFSVSALCWALCWALEVDRCPQTDMVVVISAGASCGLDSGN